MPSGAFYLAGLSGLQQLGRHSTRVSKLGSKKKGIEYLSAAPSVITLCTVDLKRPFVHLHTPILLRYTVSSNFTELGRHMRAGVYMQLQGEVHAHDSACCRAAIGTEMHLLHGIGEGQTAAADREH